MGRDQLLQDLSITTDMINDAENLFTELNEMDHIQDIQNITIDPAEFNKVHQRLAATTQNMQLLQQMQALRMQCIKYKRQMINLQYHIDNKTVSMAAYHHLKKQIIAARAKRTQQRQIISRLYAQTKAHHNRYQRQRQSIAFLKRDNTAYQHRLHSLKQLHRIDTAKNESKSVSQSQSQSFSNCQPKKQRQTKQHIRSKSCGDIHGRRLHRNKRRNSKEAADTIHILQNQLKSKDTEIKELKRVLLRYNHTIHDNQSKINTISQKVRVLKHQRRPNTDDKTTQTQEKAKKEEKTDLMDKWLSTIYKAASGEKRKEEWNWDLSRPLASPEGVHHAIEDLKNMIYLRKMGHPL